MRASSSAIVACATLAVSSALATGVGCTLGAAVVGCTFNVGWVDRDLVTTEDPGTFTTLSVDATALDGADVSILGGASTTTAAAARVAGFVGATEDPSSILGAFGLSWWRPGPTDGVLSLAVIRPFDARSSVYVESLTVDLPASRDVVVVTDGGSVDVEGMRGRIEVHASSASIHADGDGVVELEAGSGSIDARAAAGTVRTGSGSITLDLAGWVVASAESGSIAGRIGDGGSLRTGSGSIDVELGGPLGRDLFLDAGSGSIHLRVPGDASLALDLEAGGGSVVVDGAGHGSAFQGELGAGGFSVVARAGSGSIVVERGR